MISGRLKAVVLLAMSLVLTGGLPSRESVARQSEHDARQQAFRPQPPGTDLYGDPLPAGVAMRIGTVRFRDDERIEGIAYSRDGRLLVTNHGARGLRLWDAQDGRKLRRIDLGLDTIHDFAVAPDGKRLAVAGFVFDPGKRLVVHRLTFLDLATGLELVRSEGGDEHAISKLAFVADGKTVATINGDSLSFWDAASGKQSHQTKIQEDRLWSIASSSDKSRPLVAVGGKRISICNAIDGREQRKIELNGGSYVSSLAFSPDGKTLASVWRNVDAVHLWNVADGRLLGKLTGKNQDLRQVSFSPDGKQLAATGQQGHLSLWELATGLESEPFATEGLADGPLAFSPDGRAIATRGGKALHIWDRSSGKERLAMPEAHQESVQALLFLDGGKVLISGSDDRTVRLWDLGATAGRAGRQRRVFRHQGWTRAIAVSRNEQWLAVGQSYPEDGPVSLWHLPTGKLRRTFASLVEGLHPIGVRFANEGTALEVCWSDGSLRSWDTVTAQERTVVQPAIPGPRPRFPGNFARTAVFSQDGRLMALLGNMGGGLHVADLESGKQLFERGRGDAVAFTQDGRILGIVERGPAKSIKMADGRTRSDPRDSGNVIRLVDGRTGKVLRSIEVPNSTLIETIAFSPDGQIMAIGPGWERREMHLYHVGDGHEIQTIATPPGSHGSLALAFTPDGSQLVAGMADTTILVWNVRRRP